MALNVQNHKTNINMKITYQLIWMIFLLAGISSGLSSCKDDESSENEWNATYVYIQRNDYLVLNNSTFNLKHSPGGIAGNVEITFKLKIQKPAAKDITGILQISGTGKIPVSAFSLNTDHPVIKAGETESEDIILSLSDSGKEELAQTHDLLSGEFKIQLVNLQTENANTIISTNSALTSIPFSLTKQEYSINNLEIGTPEDSHLMERTSWYVQADPQAQGNVSNVIDGNAYSDIAQDNAGFWITIDFQTSKTISGIVTNHWGDAYCPTQIELFTSDNGIEWKTMGTLDVKGSIQNIKFINSVTTRHLKYQIVKFPARVDVTEFNVYEVN